MRTLVVATLLACLTPLLLRADPPVPGTFVRFPQKVGIYDLAFAPNSDQIAARGLDQIVRILDLTSQRSTVQVDGHLNRVSDLAFSPDSQQLLTAALGNGEAVRVWDTTTGKLLRELPPDSIDLCWSADGNLHVLRPQYVDTYAYNGGAYQRIEQRPVDLQVAIQPPALPLVLSPDGERLARAMKLGPRRQLLVQDLSAPGRNNLQMQVIGQIGASHVDIAFSPNRRWLALCGRRQPVVQLWNLEESRYQKLQGHEAEIQAIAFAPHGPLLATASWDQTVRLWDLLTGEAVMTLHGHQAHVCAVQFSHDGRLLASGSSGAEDNSVVVWDLFAQIDAHAAAIEVTPAATPDAMWQQLWQQLGGGPGEQGFEALALLLHHREQALPWLAAQVDQWNVAVDRDRISQAIRELGDARFAKREEAQRLLIELRGVAETQLQRTLRETKSPEIQMRIRSILSYVVPAEPVPPEKLRRWIRLVLLLEMIDLPAAEQTLHELAQSSAHAEIVMAAAAAHRRASNTDQDRVRTPEQ